MNRAYTLLSVKELSEDRREITGIATTIETDRVGDEVVPSGAVFKLPLPLLWQHDPMQPIGAVTQARIGSHGIEIKAKLAKSDTPGRLRDRLDEAWETIKSGLVRGLSIGFRELEPPERTDTGFRFRRWEWLELSPVTVGANASAMIETVKGLDARQRGAFLDALARELGSKPSKVAAVYLRDGARTTRAPKPAGKQYRDPHRGSVYLDARRQAHRGSVFLDVRTPVKMSDNPRAKGAVYLGRANDNSAWPGRRG